MELVSLNKLKEYFNLEYLMDLFKIDKILEKIKNFRFFHYNEEVEITQEYDKFWFMTKSKIGIISKVWINEEILSNFNVLKETFLMLMGKVNETVKETKTKTINGFSATKITFFLAVAGLLGWKAYKHYK